MDRLEPCPHFCIIELLEPVSLVCIYLFVIFRAPSATRRVIDLHVRMHCKEYAQQTTMCTWRILHMILVSGLIWILVRQQR
jgi:hypothetical protein